MADAWFYAHDAVKLGPFSAGQLRNLASLGSIVPTDTVWKLGVERGVLASRVKNLFMVLPIGIPPVALEPTPIAPVVEDILRVAEPAPEPAVLAEPLDDTAEAAITPPAPKPAPKHVHVRKGKATAVKGADIINQDGVQAKYRKKCTVCDHKDSSCQTITIINKTFKVNFFCPKCRKRRDVVIHCTSG